MLVAYSVACLVKITKGVSERQNQLVMGEAGERAGSDATEKSPAHNACRASVTVTVSVRQSSDCDCAV